MAGPRMLPGVLGAVVLAGCGTPVTATHRPGAAPHAAAAPQLGTPRRSAAVAPFDAHGRPVYCGARRGHLIALTFDDGPGPYSHYVLKALRREHDRATFFLVGRSIATFPRGARSDRALGAIGDHTMHHLYLPGLPAVAAAQEIAQGKAAAERSAGTVVWLFRPPYGGRSPAIDWEVARQRMTEILWDVDSTDSRISPPSDYRTIAAMVISAARPGSIVLMHDNRGQTVRALRTILPALHRRGLVAVTVPRLLAADPPSRAQLARGWAGCGHGHSAPRSTG